MLISLSVNMESKAGTHIQIVTVCVCVFYLGVDKPNHYFSCTDQSCELLKMTAICSSHTAATMSL